MISTYILPVKQENCTPEIFISPGCKFSSIFISLKFSIEGCKPPRKLLSFSFSPVCTHFLWHVQTLIFFNDRYTFFRPPLTGQGEYRVPTIYLLEVQYSLANLFRFRPALQLMTLRVKQHPRVTYTKRKNIIQN